MATASEMPPWPASVVTAVAGVLGDTSAGLTGAEIGHLLAAVRVPDPGPDIGSKRVRLGNALAQAQERDGNPRRLAALVTAAMEPARYVRSKDAFTWRQDQLNEVLSFVGLRVRDDGKLGRGARATTLTEAARHAHALRVELERRSTHPQVMEACGVEVLADNTFHALLEAVKGVFERLRHLTGETSDGAELVAIALDAGKSEPLLIINSYRTKSDRTEQTGFANLVKGLAGLYRHPVAHDPRTSRSVGDQELLEALTTVSMVHRRLDTAKTHPA
jgi:uncharacterized protein (TIGR02391 family)